MKNINFNKSTTTTTKKEENGNFQAKDSKIFYKKKKFELTWLWKVISIVLGARRHGSPSTCIGIALLVVIRAWEHWAIRSPFPPICKAAWNKWDELENWKVN